MVNYEDFMRKYHNEHYCCPNCGSRNYSTTLVGYILNLNHPEEYKDKNYCKCHDCGWEGIKHELAPKPEIQEFKNELKKIAVDNYSEKVANHLLYLAEKIYNR